MVWVFGEVFGDERVSENVLNVVRDLQAFVMTLPDDKQEEGFRLVEEVYVMWSGAVSRTAREVHDHYRAVLR